MRGPPQPIRLLPPGDRLAHLGFLNGVYRSVTTGPAWGRTALVINYDEWGGFYDHVAPPAAPAPIRIWGPGCEASGFRPC